MSERGSYHPDRTVNTASDRAIGFERGMIVGYLDTALDALAHIQQRTSAGRVWLISDDQLEQVLSWLTAQREEVLRKERVDTRPVSPSPGDAPRPLPEAIPWIRGANVRD